MQKQWMRMVFAGAAMLVFSATAYAGPLPPAAELLPPGFKVVEEQNMQNVMATIKAVSAKGDPDRPTKIQVGWQMSPMADRMIEMMAGTAEEKASHAAGSLDEPCGKQRLRGGVFTCRKWTPFMAGSSEPPRTSLRITWQGAASNGLVGINIDNAESKEAAMKLLDSMIPKITKSK